MRDRDELRRGAGGRTLIAISGQQWTEGELGVVLDWFNDWKRLGSGGQQRSH